LTLAIKPSYDLSSREEVKTLHDTGFHRFSKEVPVPLKGAVATFSEHKRSKTRSLVSPIAHTYFLIDFLVLNSIRQKRDEVMGEWRKLHNEELRDLYSSPSIIRIIK
jgi:hypothetical protein